jgi:hypothetical protein
MIFLTKRERAKKIHTHTHTQNSKEKGKKTLKQFVCTVGKEGKWVLPFTFPLPE